MQTKLPRIGFHHTAALEPLLHTLTARSTYEVLVLSIGLRVLGVLRVRTS